MKTALLVVSFGTTHLDTMKKTIVATENALAVAFPDITVFRAFTSGVVRKRLKARFDMQVDGIEEAMARIYAAGYDRVVVQPTLLIPGAEYDKLCAAIEASAKGMQIAIGKPLLCCQEDMDAMIQLLQKAYPIEDDTILLLMGHGTEHSANNIYIRLADKMKHTSMRLCTVEGTPSFDVEINKFASVAALFSSVTDVLSLSFED